MVERSRRSAGATIAACRAALREGVAVNLAGGTHHAYADKGGGFCVFNDAAIAARVLQRDGDVRRVAVVDLDVHQGNGTASILHGDPSVLEAAKDPRVRDVVRKVSRAGEKAGVVTMPKKSSGPGRYILIGLGVVAVAGVAYAAWQTLRADDELWIEDLGDPGSADIGDDDDL